MKTMATKLARGFVFAMMIASADAYAQTPQISPPTFADVIAHYQMFQTWSATIQQQYSAKAYDQTKTSSGTIRYQRPDTIDFNFGGTSVSTTCTAGSLGLIFLCGPQATAGFTFQAIAGPTMNFPGGVVFVATPIVPNPQIVKLLFYVDSTTSEVRREMVIDAQGNRNRVDFTNVVATYWH